MENDIVPLRNRFDNWTLSKRRAGAKLVISEDKTTYLCNQLYVIADSRKVFSDGFSSTIKVCCCECSKGVSCMLSTWYQYANYSCYQCNRKISTIYNQT